MPERTAMHSRGSFRGGRQVTRSDQLEPRQRALLEAPVHALATALGDVPHRVIGTFDDTQRVHGDGLDVALNSLHDAWANGLGL